MGREFCQVQARFFAAILMAAFALGNAHIAVAEEEFLASVRLRGGYDTNPTLNLGGAGATAFAGVDVAFVHAKANDKFTAGLVGEATTTQYRNEEVAPLQRYRLALNLANKEQDGISIRTDTTALAFLSYDTQLYDFEHRLRVRKTDTAFQPFLRTELKAASLNEKNVILSEFLPEPYRFLRGTIIPGLSWKREKFEVGASVSLSATRYEDKLDFFGFRRDNERIQPFAFMEYAEEKLSLFAAMSKLYGDWHDVDFTDVVKTLFHLSLEWRFEKCVLELLAMRVAADTTFPLSPVSIDTSYSAKLSRAMDDKTIAAVFVRQYGREFLDSPFRSRTDTAGFEIARELGDETSLAFEIAQSRATPIVGPAVSGTVGFVSLTKRTAADPEKKLRAGRAIPAR